MYNSKIIGLGYFVPENIVTNNDLSKFMDTTMNGFKKGQGFKKDVGLILKQVRQLQQWL